MARIGSLLKQAECRLVTLCGIGGVGKSRLAQECGRAEAGFYLNGAAYIALGGLSDTAYLHSALADALGISLQNVHDPQREIAAFLAEREMLLIFDNAEHLPGFALWLSNLLVAAPYIKTIVTSRQRLELREEWVVVLDGLPFGPSPVTPSVELLVKTAERNGQHVDRNADTTALCALLEGLPLGIELAGAMLTRSTASDLLQTVRANLDSLQARWVNTEQYHRSLRAIFQTSWDRLSYEEQSVLANLAVFEGGFTRNAAQSVADASEILLKRLEAFSLVREASERWSLHRVIRTYAREQQVAPDELLQRFESYVLRLLTQAEAEFTARNIRAAVQIMRAEIDSLRQFWQIAVDRRSSELLRLSFSMHRYYEGAGLFAEGLALFRSSLANLELDKFKSGDLRLLGRLRMHEAGMLLRLGKVSDAFSSACDAVECLSQDENDPAALAFALNAFGVAQLYQGDMNAARYTLEQCAAIYRQLQMPELLKPLVNLGAIYSRTGDTGKAYVVLHEAHGIARRISDTVGGFHVVNALGLNRMLCDEYDAALGYFEEALALSETTGFQSGKVIVLNNLGDIHNLMGRAQTGVSYAENAVTLARELEDQRGLIYSLSTLTLIQLALRQSEAVTTLREALQRAKETEAAPLLTTALYAAGEWYASINRRAEAHRVWQVISIHPATEMDYRRRATAHLGNAVLNDNSSEDTLPGLIGQILAQLP
jgi:predicted ATPase